MKKRAKLSADSKEALLAMYQIDGWNALSEVLAQIRAEQEKRFLALPPADAQALSLAKAKLDGIVSVIDTINVLRKSLAQDENQP